MCQCRVFNKELDGVHAKSIPKTTTSTPATNKAKAAKLNGVQATTKPSAPPSSGLSIV